VRARDGSPMRMAPTAPVPGVIQGSVAYLGRKIGRKVRGGLWAHNNAEFDFRYGLVNALAAIGGKRLIYRDPDSATR
jgi:hypothetical protein